MEEAEITKGYTVNVTTLEKVGEQEVEITYEGKTAKFVVQVEERLIIDLKTLTEEQEEEITYIEGISPKTTVKELKEKITTNGTIEIINGDKEIEVEENEIRTGYVIRITKGEEKKEYVVVVKGDTNGDGKADFTDILKINKHRLGKQVLEGAYLKAGDVTKDGKADFTDILKINKFRLGKIQEL